MRRCPLQQRNLFVQRLFSTQVTEATIEPATAEIKTKKQLTKVITQRYPSMKPKDVPPKFLEMSLEEI